MTEIESMLFTSPKAEDQLNIGSDPSLVIAFVAAVGVDLSSAEAAVEKKLTACGYRIERIRITKDVLPKLDKTLGAGFSGEFIRLGKMMDAGNQARLNHGFSIIALGVAAEIALRRQAIGHEINKVAYLVHSLKHPDEVRLLRTIYSNGFYQIGIHSPPKDRLSYLVDVRKMSEEEAKKLMNRDRKENQKHGQRLIDAFHLSDFFVGWRFQPDARQEAFFENNIARFLEVVFGHPNRTPTFGEYAMFLAFSASLRSADLSRQVGAVITRNREILGAGANDCPQAGGGLYWQTLNRDSLLFGDFVGGRDWTRGVDANRQEVFSIKMNLIRNASERFEKLLEERLPGDLVKHEIRSELRKELSRALGESFNESPIVDLTEFGRVVHAEMEALLSCARKGVSTIDSILFSTTFPCHNCAKHIVAAGVNKVVFIEPYLKSKALTAHDDSIALGYPEPLSPDSAEHSSGQKFVRFEPFAGIGPRRFFDLFSMNLGVGEPMKRKNDETGHATTWDEKYARPRIAAIPTSFLDRESQAATAFQKIIS